MYCPECEAACSDQAPFCPQCGHPLYNLGLQQQGEANPLRQTPPRRTAKEKWQSVGGFCVCVVLCYVVYVGGAWIFEGSVSPSSLGYTVLREWKPHKDPNGYGADLLLLNQDATAEQLIDDMKKLGKGHEPVLITIWSIRKAYDDDNNNIYGEDWERGLILTYIKNHNRLGAWNKIRWIQHTGKFSSRSGTVTKL